MNTKDEIQKTVLTEPIKKLIGYILASVSPLLLALIPLIRDFIQSIISFSLLLAITGVSISGLILSAAYIHLLRKQLKRSKEDLASKPIFRFNVYWDKELNPLCPTCKNNLSQTYGAASISVGSYSSSNDPLQLWCLKCNKRILLADDNGRELSLAEAKKRLSAENAT